MKRSEVRLGAFEQWLRFLWPIWSRHELIQDFIELIKYNAYNPKMSLNFFDN